MYPSLPFLSGRYDLPTGSRALTLNGPRRGVCASAGLSVHLDLVAGHNRWNLDLATASLFVTGPPEPLEDPEQNMMRAERESWCAVWEDEAAGLTWNGWIFCAPAGGVLLDQVPVGTIRITRRSYYTEVEGTAITVDLAPRETREVTLDP